MTASRSKPKGVREPIQVYLTAADRALLDKAAQAANMPRAEVLRRGLRRIAGELLSEEHPAVAFVNEMTNEQWPASMPGDAAQRHDEFLAESYIRRPARKRRKSK
jgi:hypothetical protein